MAVKIPTGDTDALLRYVLRREGFPRSHFRRLLRTLRYDFFITLANDIRDGRTGWPVRTGTSRASFFARPDGLYNHLDKPPYPLWLELDHRYIRNYLRSAGKQLARRVIDFAGLTPENVRAQDRARLQQRLTLSRRLSRLTTFFRGRFFDG